MTQRGYARLAGALYLLTLIAALAGDVFFRSRLFVPNDVVHTAANIVASEHIFRTGILCAVASAAGNIALLWALYVVLSPVNRNLALLGAFWRLAECTLFTVVAFTDVVALRLLTAPAYARSIDTAQLQVLARLVTSVHHPVGQIAGVFFALGSAVFAWLFLQSRFIPRWLSVAGIAASVILAVATCTLLVFPEWESAASPYYWAPTFLFEVILGFWLLLKGAA